MAGISAQGVTFTFGTTTLTITSIQINETQDLIDGSHLGIAPNGKREYVGGFATDVEVSVDYIGGGVSVGSSALLRVQGPISWQGNATVASASTSGSVGALVSSTATFRVA